MNTEPYVYIAGKYHADSMVEIEENILEAKKLAVLCAKNGIRCFCPHMNSAFMNFYAPEAKWNFWMETDRLVIEKLCNCMLMVCNWRSSKGAQVERELATELGYPIFYEFNDLLEYTKAVTPSTR